MSTAARKQKKAIYNSSRWQRLRKAVLSQNPVCVMCDQLANEVDHIVPLEWCFQRAYDWTNVQALCRECHSRKTMEESRTRRFTQMLPLSWTTQPHRWVICGPPGSGKTTWVQQHSKPGDVIWDLDEQAAQAGMGAYEERSPSQVQWLLQERTRIVQRVLRDEPACNVFVIISQASAAYRIASKLRAGVVVCYAPGVLNVKTNPIATPDVSSENPTATLVT